MSTPTVEVKSAGPEGATPVSGRATPSTQFRFTLASFMLEDYLDALEVKQALKAPGNRERIPWRQLKEELGL